MDNILVPTNEGDTFKDLYSHTAPEISRENDCSNVNLNFISELLMKDEDLGNNSCMVPHNPLALKACEKSLYDLLTNNQTTDSLTDIVSPSDCNYSVTSFSTSNSSDDGRQLDVIIPRGHMEEITQSLFTDDELSTPQSEHITTKSVNLKEMVERVHLPNMLSGNKNRYREEDDIALFGVQRSCKQLAKNSFGEPEPLELYDCRLFFSEFNSNEKSCGKSERKKQLSDRGRPKRVKEIVVTEVIVDLRCLLLQCAQAVTSFDNRTVNDLLTRIRKHSSPYGDGYERVAHYFTNAIEARTAGAGSVYRTSFLPKSVSASEMLRAYDTFVNACPFRKVANVLANRTIHKLAFGATTLHIIDFGILLGYQWPRFIQRLSKMPGGPPKLRITGIDFPEPGLHPAQRLQDTGDTLMMYCERFGVLFEYNALAQKGENIKIGDLKIDKDELLVVNSLYWLHNVPDDIIMDRTPRDDVMNLIKRINPSIFIFGAVNGAYNSPFFVTRFREALFHYSSMFDMFDGTIPRGDENRVMFEREVFGSDVINIIGCEGTERVERPETYKQWHLRCRRAGFEQLPLDQETMNFVRHRVKTVYNKDFKVDEDGNWMVQGWKGRVNNAVSFWKPANK